MNIPFISVRKISDISSEMVSIVVGIDRKKGEKSYDEYCSVD